MTLSTSVVAACCCRASFSSRVMRASFFFSETEAPLRKRRGSDRPIRPALVRSSPKDDELWSSNAGQIGILLFAGMVPLPAVGRNICCSLGFGFVPNFFQDMCELVHKHSFSTRIRQIFSGRRYDEFGID